jgi:hypothetical protein
MDIVLKRFFLRTGIAARTRTRGNFRPKIFQKKKPSPAEGHAFMTVDYVDC